MMMLSTRNKQRWIAYLALVAMWMASLVPTLSLAFPMAGANHFKQETVTQEVSAQAILIEAIFTQGICSTNGQVSQTQKQDQPVNLTKSQPLASTSDAKPQSPPNALHQHLKHCPFCQLAIDDVVLPPHNPAYAWFQRTQARIAQSVYLAPTLASFDASAHLSRAPPSVAAR